MLFDIIHSLDECFILKRYNIVTLFMSYVKRMSVIVYLLSVWCIKKFTPKPYNNRT